jgi:glycogen debranching enzyme
MQISEINTVTDQMLDEVRKLVLETKCVTKNFKSIASKNGVHWKAVKTAYYRKFPYSGDHASKKLTWEEELAAVYTIQGFSMGNIPMNREFFKLMVEKTFNVTVNNRWCNRFFNRFKKELGANTVKYLSKGRANNSQMEANVEYFIEKFEEKIKKKKLP